jgi:hypothetical protein
MTWTGVSDSDQSDLTGKKFRSQSNGEAVTNQSSSSYEYYRTIVTELARRAPSDILHTLQHEDPLGVRRVAEQIEALKQQFNRTPAIAELTSLFPCPAPARRLSGPDRRNATQLQHYHQSLQDPSMTAFIFFQHLRKAGGTHFCTLAQKNLPPAQVPAYYCMPDYFWKRDDGTSPKCAGCLHQWTNQEILERVGSHRIMGNEWDTFDVAHHFQLPAIFVTSFRAPLHRAVSQYRFECVEERGCTHKTIESYWEKRRDLYNIYTKTFSDIPRQGSFATDTASPAAAERRAQSVATALDTLLQFHLVLIMEWLFYAAGPVQQVLGFSDTAVLAQAVRPHNDRKQRTDSWRPEEYLSAEQYRIMSETLALDEILYDVARRLFLERLVCIQF